MDFRPIYDCQESYRYLDYLDKKIASKTICEADAELIRNFVSYKHATASISPTRSRKIATVLTIWRSRFLNCNFPDITDGLWMTSAGLIKGEKFTQNTKVSYLSIPKEFLLWMESEGINHNITDKGIRKVKNMQCQKVTKTPDQLLTDDEVLAMLHHTQCKPVTAALIAILYYTGMRPSEALRLKWRDLEFSNMLLKIRITDTKTGKFRYAPCSEALEYVAYWRNHYPKEIEGGAEGDNPVFVTRLINRKDYGSMNWSSAKAHITTISQVAINRKINMYIFRGSDITNSAVKGVPDAVNKAVHWGNQSTAMLSTYLLLKDSQIDSALMKRAGVEVKEESTDNHSKNLLCNKCYTMNAPGSEYCKKCGEPLSRDAIKKQLEEREIANKQQEEKSVSAMLSDVAEVFGMTVEEFTSKLLHIKTK